MKAFIFVNDDGAAYKRYVGGEIPAQFVYGISQLEKMGFEIKVAQGKIFKDLFSFILFKPNLFFMPFTKRKTMAFFLLSKLFFFKTSFVGWLHLDIFLPPKSKVKYALHAVFQPLLKFYLQHLDLIFFLSEKTMREMIDVRGLEEKKCHFVPWGGDTTFYKSFLKDNHSGNIISTGRENRDLITVMNSLVNTDIKLDIFTNDNSLPDNYSNTTGLVNINKGRWEYKELLEKVSVSKCMIIPLKIDKINYCVGLSSLIEAISLGVPVITTYNPYWYVDIEKENIGLVIKGNSVEEWTRALEKLDYNPSLFQQMSANCISLFENKCAFSYTEKIIASHITDLLKIKSI
jgi:glycosyltransferase involved in cell wall biosynthesis